MNCEIKILRINLLEHVSKVTDPSALGKGGYLQVVFGVKPGEPKIESETLEAKIESILSMNLSGNLSDHADSEDVEDHPVFDMDVKFSGLFLLPAQDAERFVNDQKFNHDLCVSFANMIYPAVRGYIIESLSFMGVGNIHLPWHMDLDANLEYVQ